MIDGLNNTVLIANELMILICSYLILLFSGFVPNIEDRFTFGYMYIGFFFASTLFNIVLFIMISIQDIKTFIKRRKMRKAVENKSIPQQDI